MTRGSYILVLLAAGALAARGQPFSFADQLYPVLERAGCRGCHNSEGVSSPTRLRFPDPDASQARIEAFGSPWSSWLTGSRTVRCCC